MRIPPPDPENSQRPYAISEDAARDAGVSLTHLARLRMCGDCATERAPRNFRSVLERIENCCSNKESYLSAQTPFAETLFRLALATRNAPANAETYAERFNELDARAGKPQVEASFIALALAADSFYFFRPLLY